jgi:hypothetical protein
MALGSIFWEREAYSAVDRLFRQSAEFCSEHAVWKLNVAHTYFMQVRRGAEPSREAGRGCGLGACRHAGMHTMHMYYQPAGQRSGYPTRENRLPPEPFCLNQSLLPLNPPDT